MKGMLVKKEENPFVVEHQDEYVCQECGDNNVENKVWVKVNTMEITQEATEELLDQWCPNCEKNVEIITKDEYIEIEM